MPPKYKFVYSTVLYTVDSVKLHLENFIGDCVTVKLQGSNITFVDLEHFRRNIKYLPKNTL
jgi:hypothetical protein